MTTIDIPMRALKILDGPTTDKEPLVVNAKGGRISLLLGAPIQVVQSEEISWTQVHMNKVKWTQFIHM